MTSVTPVRRWLWLAIAASLLTGMLPASTASAEAVEPNEDGSYGYRAQAYTSTADRVTGEKPESKLWFHAGRWWATMIPEGGTTHTIHELVETTWVDTGVEVAASTAARGDALVVGDGLYISNRGTSTLFRATWDGSRWVPRGTPSPLPVPADVPALTIAKDTEGTLWITWIEDDGVHIASAPDQSELSIDDWSNREMASLEAVGDRATVSPDDVSAVIAFTDAEGPAIGVMWSNQVFRQQFFAIHRDGAAHDVWALETIGEGETREADDHINLKTHGQTVYAAIKTEHSSTSPDPSLIKLLVRSPAGVWEDHVVAVYDEHDTRPIAVLEVTSRYAYVFMTRNPEGDQRHIVYKRARLADVAVGAGVADPFEGAVTFIRSDSTRGVDDATSMKANATSESGIVVLASTSTHYWWNRIEVDAPPPPSYELTTSVDGEGSIELDPAEGPYSAGTTVQVTAVAAEGWSFAEWSGDLSGSTNPTSVVMDGPRSITATFTEDPPPDTFIDDDGSIFEADIEAIAAAGITKGCNPPDNTRFCPTDEVTRGQMAAFLRRAFSLPAASKDYFTDDDGSIFEADINALAEAGITKGCNPPDNTLFCPNDEVTRGQMAAFLKRAFGYPAASTDYFVDDDGSLFEADINAIAKAGVTKGCNPPDNTRYCVQAHVTRGQMAAFLRRALGL
jgi:hypothetical protein